MKRQYTIIVPLVSIIVPVYNEELYLEQCIDSILNQNLEEIELILINDGSTDKSGVICDNYAKIDSRVKVIHQQNLGVSQARENGLLQSSGKFVAFADGDDHVSPDIYVELLNLIEKYDADISCCSYSRIKTKGKVTKVEKTKLDMQENISVISNIEALYSLYPFQYKENRNVVNIVLWNKLYRKELFRKIEYCKNKKRVPVYYFEDLIITPLLLHHSEKVVVTRKSLYYYRILEDSLYRQKFSLYKVYFYKSEKVVLEFLSTLKDQELYKIYLEGYGNYLIKTWLLDKDWLSTKVAEKINKDVLREYRSVFKSLIMEADCKIIYKISFIIFRINPCLWFALVKIIGKSIS